MKKADVRVDSSGAKERPYTIQHGGCGEGGLYIHFSPDYITTLTEDPNIRKYGKPGKVFVHEWAHHRYGIFDEYGRADDGNHPLFYRRQGSSKIYPNICSNVQPIFYTRLYLNCIISSLFNSFVTLNPSWMWKWRRLPSSDFFWEFSSRAFVVVCHELVRFDRFDGNDDIEIEWWWWPCSTIVDW